MSEKQIVFGDDGNPKEIRYYENGKLAARLGVILDGDKNFIGLRELNVEEVSPPSWLEKLGLRKPQPKPSISILTIDFIGLINWINTIKTIKTIENIDLLKEITNILNIDNIANIDVIGEITRIKDVPFWRQNLIANYSFELGDLTGWRIIGGNPTVLSGEAVSKTGLYVCSLRYDADGVGRIGQCLSRSVPSNDIKEFYVLAKLVSGTATLRITVNYPDATYSEHDFIITGTWTRFDIVPTAGKIVSGFKTSFASVSYGAEVYIDEITLLSREHANVFAKHDNKTYKTTVFDASASGNLVAAVAAKVIKLHALTIQAQGTVVVNLNNGSGGASLMEWSFQAREGAVVPMANTPAYWAITGVNTALYVTLSVAVTVTITAIYSDDDAS